MKTFSLFNKTLLPSAELRMVALGGGIFSAYYTGKKLVSFLTMFSKSREYITIIKLISPSEIDLTSTSLKVQKVDLNLVETSLSEIGLTTSKITKTLSQK